MKYYYTYLLLYLLSWDTALASFGNRFHILKQNLSESSKTLDTILNKPFSKKLLDLNNIKRPSKCPLKSLETKLLHQKLRLVSKALHHGKCLNNNKQILAGLEQLTSQATLTTNALTQEGYQSTVSSADSLSILTSEESTQTSTSYIDFTSDNLKAADYETVIGYLGKITEDKECLNNLKSQNFLSTLGNIATTMGQSAMLVPSASGFMFSAAGVGFGATLKVLSGLFKAKFDWKLPEERAQFQELNCSFFDLRREIEKARIFETSPKQKEEQIQQLEAELESLKQFHANLLEKQAKFQKTINKKKSDFIAYHKKTKTAENTKKINIFLKSLEEQLTQEKKIFLISFNFQLLSLRIFSKILSLLQKKIKIFITH